MKKVMKCIFVTFISLFAVCFVNLIWTQPVCAAETTIRWIRGIPYDTNGYRIIMSGEEIALIATSAQSDKWLSGGWNSTDSNVARVTYSKYYGCIVTGRSSGTCTISYDGSTMYYLYDALTGKYLPMVNKQHEEFRIRVVKGVSSITLNRRSLNLKTNGSAKLSYSLSPSNDFTKALTTVTYSSSNTAVATVDTNGNIKGVKAGTATIIAKTGNGKTATCKVTVTKNSSSAKAPSRIKLNKTALTLKKGSSTTLKYSLTPGKAKSTVKWSSSNTKVATVSSSGKVTAKSYGNAVITVKTANGKRASCNVKVPAPKVEKINLNKTSLKLYVGETSTIKYSLSPKGATTNVSFQSSKPSVATITSKGEITAKKAGETTITVKTANGKKATCKVTVNILPIKKIILEKTSLNLETGDKYKMAYTLFPKNATGDIKWSSSNTSVATVDSHGEITAKTVGNTTITAKYSSNIYAECIVTIVEKTIETSSIEINDSTPYFKVGESMNLKASVFPANTTDTVTWTSSNSSVASVSSDGVVRGLKTGGVTITAKAGSKSASVQIAVVSGDVYDISKGELLVLSDGVTNDSIDYCGKKYAYNSSEGITIVQSDPSKSNYIRIGGGKVTFANVHMSGIFVDVEDYLRQPGDPYAGDIIIEFMEGTENSFTSCKFSYASLDKSPLMIIQGKGKVNINSENLPAISGKNITIKDVTMTARVKSKTCAVIGSGAGIGCKNITIESSAHITAYGGYRAVGAGKNGVNTNISIASGTVTHIP